jgi:hypothetical protein
MFMETVDKDGVVRPRFSPITDSETIAALDALKAQMYGA